MENKRENDILSKKVTYLKYPIVAKCCATGHTNQYSVSYNPIYVNPSKRLLNHNWRVSKLEYVSSLYNKQYALLYRVHDNKSATHKIKRIQLQLVVI